MEETEDGGGVVAVDPRTCVPATALLICSPQAVRAVPLAEGAQLVLGRAPTSQLMVSDSRVSRVHARFTRRDGRVWVEDLGSRHGTWIGERRIEQAELGCGAAVRVADTVIVLTQERRRPQAAPTLEAQYLSPRMRELRELLGRAARTALPVLVLGETGTGKELAARELHRESARARGKLHVLNCAAIPPHLIESTLFGHERGAFTGADRARAGIFEEAHGSTLFLDEVGELALPAQAALLRVLETQRLTRIGATREVGVDVRLIAATHRDLHAMVARGEFRVDLLHRLSVISIELPSLRERRDEIAELARRFLVQSDDPRALSPNALALLESYRWPGNVRELRNVIARASALGTGACIDVGDFPTALQQAVGAAKDPALKPILNEPATLRAQLASVERSELARALAKTDGNQRRAAALLGISLRTFERRIQRLRRDEAAAGDLQPSSIRSQ